MKYFSNITTAEELKKEFRRLSIELHPDRNNGNDSEFKTMLAEYQEAQDRINGVFTEFKHTRRPSASVAFRRGMCIIWNGAGCNKTFYAVVSVSADGSRLDLVEVSSRMCEGVEFFEYYDLETINDYITDCRKSYTLNEYHRIQPLSQEFGIGWYYDDTEGAELYTEQEITDFCRRAENIRKYGAIVKAEREEQARKAEEERKAAERKEIKAWRGILEQLPPLFKGSTGEAWNRLTREERKAEDKQGRKVNAQRLAAFKRNIKAVFNHYFPGVKVSVSDSSKCYCESSEISWTDGPTVAEVQAIPELYYFIGSGWCAAGPYEDYGHRTTLTDWSEWRELFGSWSDDKITFRRTLSESHEEKINNALEAMGAEWEGRDAEGKITSNSGTAIINSLQLDKFITMLGGSLEYNTKGDEEKDLFTKSIRDYYWHAEQAGTTEDGGSLHRVYASILRKTAREGYRIPKAEQEAQRAEENAPQFTPEHGTTYKAIKKALGGSIFLNLSDGKEWPHHTELDPIEAAEAITEGKTVALGKYYDFDDYRGTVQTSAGGSKTQEKRAEKFAAVGFEIIVTWSVYKDVIFSSVNAETLAALRQDAEEVARQRKEWEEAQKNGKTTRKESTQSTDSKTTEPTETATGSAPEGLELVNTAEGVEIHETKKGATFKHRKEIRANGGDWDKVKKVWFATDADKVQQLRDWFGVTSNENENENENQSEPQTATEPEPQSTESTTTDTESKTADTMPEGLAQAFADFIKTATDTAGTLRHCDLWGEDKNNGQTDTTEPQTATEPQKEPEQDNTPQDEPQTTTGQKIRFSWDDVPELDELNENREDVTPCTDNKGTTDNTDNTDNDPHDPTDPTPGSPKGGAPDDADKIRKHFERYARQAADATDRNEHTSAVYWEALALIYNHGENTIQAAKYCEELERMKDTHDKRGYIMPEEQARRAEIEGELITLCVSEYGEDLAAVLFGAGTVKYHLQQSKAA